MEGSDLSTERGKSMRRVTLLPNDAGAPRAAPEVPSDAAESFASHLAISCARGLASGDAERGRPPSGTRHRTPASAVLGPIFRAQKYKCKISFSQRIL